MDDGSGSVDESISMLEALKSQGVDCVIATPHFLANDDSVDSFLQRRDACREKLEQAMSEDHPLLLCGAEVKYYPGIAKMQGLERLAIAGTNVILLEMPIGRWSDLLFDTVLGVRDRGLIPVLAHIDRYDMNAVNVLLDKGILAQVNVEAFGLFKSARPYVELMRAGKVVALGSDLHKVKRKAYRHFARVKRKLGPLADEVFARTAELLKAATPITAPQTAENPQTV